ncbi:homoprotocatechuate degradation operon regulator HpaR [Xenorhabdus sp. IM139775]|uniref:homoprotocatechuate degradation operon regulator HpaR n=1 Tax=Xenorhabdus sp. IM139775 TaxID=3025876 RepID=UPI00235A334A|nr:homoprotocatechuate degradation operon regulator HpaR [Xenorhabdus sp. IM139775]MDC9594539.1 homoprotocatechuate degradation operon regulator HpaR [Xenorhabdus sp. IM139775]
MHESLTIALLQARETAMGFFRPILKSYNLTEQQWRIIRVLASSRSIDFHDLACLTCILRPSLTGILTRMERDGLIFRLKPMNDQRKLYVSLTPVGQELYEQAKGQVTEGYEALETAFSPEKLTQLLGLLDEFNAIGNPYQENLDE